MNGFNGTLYVEVDGEQAGTPEYAREYEMEIE